jgi:hypothetical protein
MTIDQVADAVLGTSPASRTAMMLHRDDMDICSLDESRAFNR